MKLKFTFLLVYTFVFAHGEKEDLPDLWNEFRGPNGSGIRMDAKIGVPSMQELLWKTPLPFGLSCPVLSVCLPACQAWGRMCTKHEILVLHPGEQPA